MKYLLMLLMLAEPIAQPITLKVTPFIQVTNGSGVGQVRASWYIPRHPDNRHTSLAWSDGDFKMGSSIQDMDGEDSRTNYEKFIGLGVGVYRFEACVYRSNTDKYCDSQEVTVQ
jgi:hypothetical protein